ncbi:metalloregulator ArsR/SmtB family transcription factor [Cutibacterium equinum]|uniref:Metalloregulator ArsR/SmtB family transcription factor n=1 Tax=Cutibacterium equinum TaxID=3016342 RepID=A0ABY7R0Q8_9ACTN|nr:metalloregulator ArsR/SmtB family transcription factor [Cutibacterium equinum]WCC80873.1 metalloregulator ArsR/SmtB family transcription factor [Cutibacterium equinum]
MSEDTHTCTFGVDSAYVDLAAEVFALLADPTRIRIILALRDGEMSVKDLADVVAKRPTAVSQHLAKLRMGRMVSARRDGTTMYYSLTDEHARNLVSQAVFQAEHDVDAIPTHHMVEMTHPKSCPARHSSEA